MKIKREFISRGFAFVLVAAMVTLGVSGCVGAPDPEPVHGARLDITFAGLNQFDSSGKLVRRENYSAPAAEFARFVRSVLGVPQAVTRSGQGDLERVRYAWSGFELDWSHHDGNYVYVERSTVNGVRIVALDDYQVGDVFPSKGSQLSCATEQRHQVNRMHVAGGSNIVGAIEDPKHQGVIGAFAAPKLIEGC